MLTVTETAKNQLDSFFSDKPKASIRIYLSEGGCAGPRLALAMDEKNEGDDAFDVSGYTFLVESDLMAKAKPLTVDLTHMGFQILSSLELPKGGCSSGSCSTGSCCG
ncbi:MAG: IscA/HesB family protein [Acidobacteriota bacterium]